MDRPIRFDVKDDVYNKRNKVETVSDLVNDLHMETYIDKDIIADLSIIEMCTCLSKREAYCILLHYIKKHTINEVSKELNISSKQVETYLDKAKKKLCEYLYNIGGYEGK